MCSTRMQMLVQSTDPGQLATRFGLIMLECRDDGVYVLFMEEATDGGEVA